jgi:hypothetical protein
MLYALILKKTNKIIGIANKDYPLWTYHNSDKLRVAVIPYTIERPFELLGEYATILEEE